MLNIKKLSVVALLLLLVGVVGSISTYKFTSKFITEEIKVKDDSFTKIEVSINDAQVELIPTNGPDTLIEISGHDLKNNFSATVAESTLSIVHKESKKKLYNFDFATKPTTLKVYIPKQRYDTVQIQNDNGSFSAENIDATEVSVKVNDGQIHLKHVTANSVSIVSDNGKVELEEIKGELSAKADHGRITLLTETLNYPIEFVSQNGEIDIQTDNMPTNATIHTQVDYGHMLTFGERQSQPVVFGLGEHKINLIARDGGIIVKTR